MKNARKTGHSVRHGNRPAPYTKFKKRQHVYGFRTNKLGESVPSPQKFRHENTERTGTKKVNYRKLRQEKRRVSL